MCILCLMFFKDTWLIWNGDPGTVACHVSSGWQDPGFPLVRCWCCLDSEAAPGKGSGAALLLCFQSPLLKTRTLIALESHPGPWQRPVLQTVPGIAGTQGAGWGWTQGFLLSSQPAALALIADLSEGRRMCVCLPSATANPCPQLLIRPSFCLEELGINFMASFP